MWIWLVNYLHLQWRDSCWPHTPTHVVKENPSAQNGHETGAGHTHLVAGGVNVLLERNHTDALCEQLHGS